MPARERPTSRFAAQEHDPHPVAEGPTRSKEGLGWPLGDEGDRGNGGCHELERPVATLDSQQVSAEGTNDPDPATCGQAPGAFTDGMHPGWVRQAAEGEEEPRLQGRQWIEATHSRGSRESAAALGGRRHTVCAGAQHVIRRLGYGTSVILRRHALAGGLQQDGREPDGH